MAEAAHRVLLPPISAPTVEIEAQNDYHTPRFSSFAASLLWSGDRRFEAETYLASGYGLRLAIESQPQGWKRFEAFGRVWQPSRLKGIQVGPRFGTPFLAATQVFDLRPVPRKWLALERTHDASNRLVSPGDIVVTCSGSVGRATLTYAPHENTLISHDLLRVEARDPKQWGWIYAYLRSPQARSMMSGMQYGHIIKHLEVSHLDALPVPIVNDKIAADFAARVREILAARNESYELATRANALFEEAVGLLSVRDEDTGFSKKASNFFKTRRRLEASFHAPIPTSILERFSESSLKVDSLEDVTERVWWQTRFARFYGDAGIPYLSADQLFTINPSDLKRILVQPDDGHENFFVQKGWILMACSGQIYGLNGSAVLATEYHENIFFSHDLIRIIPNSNKIRSGYLLTALTNRTLGRPLLIRAAYGTSIPHLDPKDVSSFPVVRLNKDKENAIADLAESSAELHSRADEMERMLTADAGVLIDRFIAGESLLNSLTDKHSTATLNDKYISKVTMLKERLESFEQLQDNWDEDGAERPNELALSRARLALQLLEGIHLEPSTVLPSVDNGVGIAFESGDKYAEIEFANDGQMGALIDDSKPKAWKIANENEITSAIKRIQEFLNGN